MSKSLREAKATDMFRKAASGLGSSVYGTQKKKQKEQTQEQPTQPAQPPAPEPTEAPADFKPQKGTIVQIKNQKGTSVQYRFGGNNPLKWLSPKHVPVTDKLLLKKLNLQAFKQQKSQQPATQPTNPNQQQAAPQTTTAQAANQNQQQVTQPASQNNTPQQQNINYVELNNKLRNPELNKDIREYENYIHSIKDYLIRNHNDFKKEENEFADEYIKLNRQYQDLNENNDYIVSSITLSQIIIEYLEQSQLVFAAEAKLQQNFDQLNKDANKLKQDFFDNTEKIIKFIEQKAQEQSNKNKPITESLIRRWKVLANIK